MGLDKKNTKLILSFPYSKQAVADAKQIGGGKWNSADKTWAYNVRKLPQLLEFCKSYSLPVSEAAQAAADDLESVFDVELYNAGIRIYPGPGAPLPDTVHSQRDGDWIKAGMINLSEVLAWADANDKRVDPALTELVKTQFFDEAANWRQGTSLSAPKTKIRGLKTEPLEEQWVPAYVVGKNRKVILADEQGLGKTLEALMTARVEGDESERMLIVCPDRLTVNWEAEMGIHFEEGIFTPWIATSRTPKPIPEGTDAVLIGWSVLNYWLDTLKKWDPDFTVTDEGHYAKAGRVVMKETEEVVIDKDQGVTVKKGSKKVGGSFRGSAVLSLFQSRSATDKILYMTGTPIPSRPKELLPVLQAMKIEGYFGGSMLYQMRYCDGKQKWIGAGRGIGGRGYVWDFSGGSNLVELNTRLLSSGHYVRRTKQHLVEQGAMPTKTVDGVDFFNFSEQRTPTVIAGSADYMKEYIETELGVSEELAELAIELGRKYRTAPNSQRVLQKIAAEGKRSEGIFKLRRIAGMAGIEQTITHVQKLIDAQEKVVLVAHHKDVVKAYMEQFDGAVSIQGAMTTKKIEEAKALFNAPGFDTPVMVLALEAGKTGHTLCKQPDKTCANMVIAEGAWNPSDDWQVQDRIWRIGQNRPVTITNLVVEGTVQQHIYDQRTVKERNVYGAIDGITLDTEGDDKSVAGDIAVNLARRGLERAQ